MEAGRRTRPLGGGVSGEESARASFDFLAGGHGEKTSINKDFMLK